MTNPQPVDWLIRGDGRLEFICERGVGHTVAAPRQERAYFVHGCDGKDWWPRERE